MIDATKKFATEQNIAKDQFEFQMLYGVRRDLQENLIKEGYKVRIYVPYGDEWYSYLCDAWRNVPPTCYLSCATSCAANS